MKNNLRHWNIRLYRFRKVKNIVCCTWWKLERHSRKGRKKLFRYRNRCLVAVSLITFFLVYFSMNTHKDPNISSLTLSMMVYVLVLERLWIRDKVGMFSEGYDWLHCFCVSICRWRGLTFWEVPHMCTTQPAWAVTHDWTIYRWGESQFVYFQVEQCSPHSFRQSSRVIPDPMLLLTSPTSPPLCGLPLSPVSHVDLWKHLNTTYLLVGENYTFQHKAITQSWETIHTVSLMKTSRWQKLEGTQIGV